MRKEKRISGKLMAYTAAATAAMAMGSDANAQIISYEGPWTASGTNDTLISFNLAGDVSTDGTSVSNWDFKFRNLYSTSGSMLKLLPGISSQTNPSTANKATPYPLSAGTLIDDTMVMVPALIPLYGVGQSATIGYWSNEQRAFLGLRFADTGTPLYGWADIQVHSAKSLTLYGFAYEDTGADIEAGDTGNSGQVPEPSTLALMALGAIGLAAVRRRNAAS